MFIIHARIETGPTCTQARQTAAVALHRLVIDGAAAEDGLQHLYVDVRDTAADLVFFLLQPTLVAAESTAVRLIQLCLSTGSPVSAWTLSHCGATLPGVVAVRVLLGPTD